MPHQRETIPFCDLRPGAEIGINARSAPPALIEELAMSLRVNGQLAPLGVWRDPDTGVAYVAFGNRRRLAFAFNVEAEFGFIDDPIDCLVLDVTREHLLAISLVENVDRMALHPAEQVRAFAAMAVAGMTHEEIGNRFGLLEREVRQRLALGEAAPEVLDAWLAGDIDEGAVKAFTVVPDKARQAAVLAELTYHHPNYIRIALLGDGRNVRRDMAFVGEDAYRAAGGVVDEDLFGKEEDRLVRDVDVLALLAREKAHQIVDAEREKGGWKWVEFERDLPDGARWSWQHWTIKPKKADRKNLGAIVCIEHDGSVEIAGGYTRPEDLKAEKSKAGAGVEQAPKGEPAAVMAMAWEAQTRGLAEALAADPGAAKIALCATLFQSIYGDYRGSPLSVRWSGAHAYELEEEEEELNFPDAIAHCRSLSPGDLDRFLARLVARAVDATAKAREPGHYGKHVTDATVAPVLGLVDLATLTTATRRALNVASYFDGARKEAALEALREVGGDGAADRVAKGKKGEIAKAAAALVDGRDWLPPSIRPPGYQSPKATPLADAATDAQANVTAKRAKRAKAAADV